MTDFDFSTSVVVLGIPLDVEFTNKGGSVEIMKVFPGDFPFDIFPILCSGVAAEIRMEVIDQLSDGVGYENG